LRRIQQPAVACYTSAGGASQGLGACRFVTLADVEYACAAQPSLLRDFVVGPTRLAQSEDLHAPLMPRIARQRSHVGCFHPPSHDGAFEYFKLSNTESTYFTHGSSIFSAVDLKPLGERPVARLKARANAEALS
jgi:hypothetical protein